MAASDPANANMNLPGLLEQDRIETEKTLDALLPAENVAPESIHRAMRYSVFAGGKRIRPALCLEAARLFDANRGAALEVACALEFIHTYSLIHDDLPALDNDDLRRGKPTCHKQFSEPLAILAGDGLLTLAFHALSRARIDPERRLRILQEISAAAGTVSGMVGGQVADVEAEGKAVVRETLEYIHRSKTAALIRASATAGAFAGNAGEDDISHVRAYGEKIGLAFQIVDDILDVEESSAALGKTAGKDQKQKKATYPALYGVEQSHRMADKLRDEAIAELAPYGARATPLEDLACFLTARRA